MRGLSAFDASARESSLSRASSLRPACLPKPLDLQLQHRLATNSTSSIAVSYTHTRIYPTRASALTYSRSILAPSGHPPPPPPHLIQQVTCHLGRLQTIEIAHVWPKLASSNYVHRRGDSKRGLGSASASAAFAGAESSGVGSRIDGRAAAGYVVNGRAQGYGGGGGGGGIGQVYDSGYANSEVELTRVGTSKSGGGFGGGGGGVVGYHNAANSGSGWEDYRSGPISSPGLQGGNSYVSGVGRPPTTISIDDSDWASNYRGQGAGAGGLAPPRGASGLKASPSTMTRPTLRGIPAPPVRGIARLWAWIPASLPIRIFLLVTLLESGVDIAIETVLLLRFKHQEGSIVGVNKDGDQPALPVFVMVFCLAHVYQCALAVDAVVNRNSILIFGLVIFNLAL